METVSTGKMIDMLLENPKRKAVHKGYEIYFKEGSLVVDKGLPTCLPFRISQMDNHGDAKWQIIEPEPAFVDFVTAFKAYTDNKRIKSHLNVIYSSIDSKGSGFLIEAVSNLEIDNYWKILD